MNKIQVLILSCLLLSIFLYACTVKEGLRATDNEPLRVGMAPYQEMALLINEKNLGLEQKYGTKVQLFTMPWEDILPAVGSANQSIDVGFAGLEEYLAKSENLNRKGADPILFIFPGWTYYGGGFIAFNPKVPELTSQNINDANLVKKFLACKLGVQKNSCNHMLLWILAQRVGLKLADLPITDTTLNDGFLAAENGSLDAAAAGLTQITEALKRNGRVVVTMDDVGLTAPGGFVCKESTYKSRKKDIDALIRMWFDCTNYVLSDPDHHSAATLAYLKANSSTKYTLIELRSALREEYIPTSLDEANKEIVYDNGKYSINRIVPIMNAYLLDVGAVKNPVPMPKLIVLK